jgi:hypothetical protein
VARSAAEEADKHLGKTRVRSCDLGRKRERERLDIDQNGWKVKGRCSLREGGWRRGDSNPGGVGGALVSWLGQEVEGAEEGCARFI